jgi:NAD(P)-dependent dehydrogenase (short-subunit alcohol dehydrogenase family)
MDASTQEQRRTMFITGAASGIGRATAMLFARRGWFVGLADIDEAALAGRLDGAPAARDERHGAGPSEPLPGAQDRYLSTL